MGKSAMEFKGMVDPEGVIGLLGDFAKGFKEGKIYIQRGNEYVTLAPTQNISVELKAGEKKDREKISLEFSWSKELLATDTSEGIAVMTTEPKIETPEPEAVEEKAEAVAKEAVKDAAKEVAPAAEAKKTDTPAKAKTPAKK